MPHVVQLLLDCAAVPSYAGMAPRDDLSIPDDGCTGSTSSHTVLHHPQLPGHGDAVRIWLAPSHHGPSAAEGRKGELQAQDPLHAPELTANLTGISSIGCCSPGNHASVLQPRSKGTPVGGDLPDVLQPCALSALAQDCYRPRRRSSPRSPHDHPPAKRRMRRGKHRAPGRPSAALGPLCCHPRPSACPTSPPIHHPGALRKPEQMPGPPERPPAASALTCWHPHGPNGPRWPQTRRPAPRRRPGKWQPALEFWRRGLPPPRHVGRLVRR
mmetsp:Transcript_28510/g.66070  ORF Transcript_28510/g.66070 Transcript_28510/m.66070 type:complete len:270 (+) Transcript_28510:291-1100(+)